MRQFIADKHEHMTLRFSHFLPAIAFAIALFLPQVAKAQFAVCNQSFDVVNVAIGQQEAEVFATEGWWTIGTNQCANVIQDVLQNRYIYVYATDVFGQPLLDGATTMCVGPKRFKIDGVADCWRRGYQGADFFEVDTQATERWTIFLTPPGGG